MDWKKYANGIGEMVVSIVKSDKAPKEKQEQKKDPKDVPDIKEVAAEVAKKIASGEIEPSEEAVALFIKQKGIDENEAKDAAHAIVEEFFQQSDEGEEDLQKSLLAEMIDMKSGIEAIALAVMKSLEAIQFLADRNNPEAIKALEKDLSSTKEELQKTKSELDKYLSRPADKKDPVMSGPTSGISLEKQIPQSVIKSHIIAGIQAGALSQDDAIIYDNRRELTDNLKKYINEQEGKK